MIRYLIRRLIGIIPILFAVSIVVFVFVRQLPGTAGVALLGERATAASVEQVERGLGLDRPLHEQYLNYMENIFEGDLGRSVSSRRPVSEELSRRFPATVELSVAAMIFSLGLGVPLGFLAARRYRRPTDHLSLVGSLIGISFPVFFLALLLKYLFGVKLGWLPTIGRLESTTDLAHPTGFYVVDAIVTNNWSALGDVLKHLVLPAVALGTIPLAIVARITRAAVLDVMSEDYVRTAHAKGLALTTVNRRHIFKNAMLPVVTVAGLQIGLLLTGAILTETVFSWPGVGSWMLNAIRYRDYVVIQGGVIFFAFTVILVNLLVDVSYAFLNPKIRYR